MQRTPLITTSVTFPESQYHVSWGGVGRSSGEAIDSSFQGQSTNFGDKSFGFPFLPSYLQTMVGVAQTKLPAGHHGLQCSPVIPTDEAPAKMPGCPYLHLNSPLITASAPTQSDL